MLKEHYGYVSDACRLAQYQAALNSIVRPGDHCVDLGCGTGVLGLLALKAGAEHIHCIDDTRVISLARETYRRAGLAHRVTFYQGRSQQISLPRLADVLFCDHVGYFGVDYRILPLLEDAARRFLRPGGKIAPRSIQLEIAAVGSAHCSELARQWMGANVPAELRWLHEYEANTKHAVDLKREDIFTNVVQLATIDLRETQPEYFTWKAALRAQRAGLLDGLGGWFTCDLAPGICMTNSPESISRISRSQAFFPFESSIAVQPGDELHVTILARAEGDIFGWTVEHPAAGLRQTQTNWKSQVMSDADLVDAGPGHVPALTPTAQARQTVLAYCNGKRDAVQIEEAVLREHPHLFPSAAETKVFVKSVLKRDTR